MKKNILLYVAAVAGLALAGCNKESGMPQGNALDMTVKASIGDLTKVAYDGASTTFQTGDQLAFWAWTGEPDDLPDSFVVNGEVNTLGESGAWVPATQMLWRNLKDKHYFMAVHPVPANAIADLSAVPYEVDNTNYEASDLLLATELTGLKAEAKTVDLTFTHAMAKLQVNLKFRNQFGPSGPNPEIVAAALVGKATGTVNYLTKQVTPTGVDGPVGMVLVPKAEGYAMSFSGIQIPQKATQIVVAVGETTFSYTHPEPLPIVPGKVTTMSFIVGQDVIMLESVSVNNWIMDEPLAGGEAELEADVDLSELTADYVARGRVVFKGELIAPVKISVDDGATVTLDGVTINGVNDANYKWAGITCLGDATIILKEGSTNLVRGFHEDFPGIYIAEGKTLIIKGDGSLTASPVYYKDTWTPKYLYGEGAAIGGGKNAPCGNIEIQGGNITAIGGYCAAGIGGGNGNSNCGTITISGGTVVATGDGLGAGIGCGLGSDCGTITISGGSVEATGGNSSAPGIGSAFGESNCSGIIISGGVVTATGGTISPGIGSAHSPSVCGDIIISGGTVTATGYDYSPGIGASGHGSDGGTCGNITITDGVTLVTATKGEYAPNSIGAGANATCGTVTIGGMETGSISTSPYMYPIDLSKVTSDLVAGNGARMFETLAGNYKISIDDGATVILDNATISYSGKGADYAGLTLIGDGTIQLADGTTNNAIGGLDSQGYSNWPGIFVPEGKTLTINGNTGVLNAARGGDDVDDGSPAGIGAAWKYNCGSIVINGGVINATGGAKSAGIGGAFTRTCGDITINGGTITAIGHAWGSGIGLGAPVAKSATSISGCNITITGGTVTATGGVGGSEEKPGGAGIGTGYARNTGSGQNTITLGIICISGGTVKATGGVGAAAIGTGGTYGNGINNSGNITITDGVTKVTATKGSGATNSIGKGGGNGTCGTVTVGGAVGEITDSPYIYPEPPKDISKATARDVGKVIGANGIIYNNAEAAASASTTAVAIIAYVGAAGSVDASSATYKGLAIALSDASKSALKWADGEDYLENCLSGSGQTNVIATAIGYKNGITCTNTLIDDIRDEHTHAAATAAVNNNNTAAAFGTSGWFLPSVGQWNLIVQGLATKKAGSAVTTDLAEEVVNDTYKAVNLNSVITSAGGTGLVDGSYWSSTEYDISKAWIISFGQGYAEWMTKPGTQRVRSVLAF